MGIVLDQALIVDFWPPAVEAGALRIDGGIIVERGPNVAREADDEVVDCRGRLVLPRLVNGHTHLYSALAVGMPPPTETPQTFPEILERIWWRLDRAHDAESIETSARIGALDALRCGTTTLIDHHASPNLIDGSLDLIERGIAAVGLRGILCYETTDRHGPQGAQAGLEENRRYLTRRIDHPSTQFAAMVGAHAAFTLEERTLEALAQLAGEFDRGVHIHVAEDSCDENRCQERFQILLIDHLANHGLLSKTDSLFVHCTHLDVEALTRLAGAGGVVAHCPRSNMNNAVGTLPMAATKVPYVLGTDGHGSDMFCEARLAYLAARQDGVSLAPAQVLAGLARAGEFASRILDVRLGALQTGCVADVVLTDYRAATPLDSDNLAAHVVFALGAQHVCDVLAGGRWLLRARRVVVRDEEADRAGAQPITRRLWERMEQQ